MTRRPGLSLTEVLVALFIMGIGTIAILTLFPLGALNMAQAFRDDRTTQSAAQADAFLRWYVKSKKDDGLLYPNAALKIPGEPFIPALDDPGSANVSKFLLPVGGRGGPSYPVFIDPMGFAGRPSTGTAIRPQAWAGDSGFGDNGGTPNSSAIPRTSINLIGTNQLFALRVCTLLDGFGYDKGTGAPDTNSGTIDRDVRYNWLWVLQRPDNTRSPAAPATMTVVVFDKRAPGFTPAGSETVFTPTFAQPGQSRISFTGSYPPVQKGGWLMDATVVAADAAGTSFVVPPADGGGPPPAGYQPWIRNANFYRVVSVTEYAGGGGADIELELPLRPDVVPPGLPGSSIPLPQNYRRFIFLNGAAEVFERQTPLDL